MSYPSIRANVPYTYEHYCLLPDDGKRYEIIEGELYVSPSPTSMHQTVSRRLQYQLMTALEETRQAYVFNAPTDLILGKTTVVVPDLALIRTSRRDIISKRGIEAAPDLLVEILSPSNRSHDEILKRATYAKFGIGEYWVVDPDEGWIDQLILQHDGYAPATRFDSASVLTSPTFPTIAIPMASIFAPL